MKQGIGTGVWICLLKREEEGSGTGNQAPAFCIGEQICWLGVSMKDSPKHHRLDRDQGMRGNALKKERERER